MHGKLWPNCYWNWQIQIISNSYENHAQCVKAVNSFIAILRIAIIRLQKVPPNSREKTPNTSSPQIQILLASKHRQAYNGIHKSLRDVEKKIKSQVSLSEGPIYAKGIQSAAGTVKSVGNKEWGRSRCLRHLHT